jgi:hypothetical protein
MTIFIINGKPHTARLNSFEPIDYLTYMELIESGEINDMEVIEL